MTDRMRDSKAGEKKQKCGKIKGKNKNKKMNTYLKYALLLLACLVIGWVIGYSIVGHEESLISGGTVVQQVLHSLRIYILPLMLILVFAEVILGESILLKYKNLGNQILTVENEEGDCLDYNMEKVAAIGTAGLMIVYFLSIILLATGYSLEYIKEAALAEDDHGLLIAMIVFLIINCYYGFWSVRLVKLQQKVDPRMKGDPASMKFSEQWIEGCDEAEKERIYRSSFHSYALTGKYAPLITMFAMLTHLIWNTGIAAVIYTGIIWLMLNLSYIRNCLRMMKENLSR